MNCDNGGPGEGDPSAETDTDTNTKDCSDSVSFVVTEGDSRERIDHFISGRIKTVSRSRIKTLILEGGVLLNNQSVKPSFHINSGDIILINVPAAKAEPSPQPEDLPLKILYSDKSVIVVDKPAGMAVHPGAGRTTGTLVNALLFKFADISSMQEKIRPGIVHRLDKDTSGILVIARNSAAVRSLVTQFKRHSVQREYTALVWGIMMRPEGTIDIPVGRDRKNRKLISTATDRGKRALTHYRAVRTIGNFSVLKLCLETGRTHQIRVHMAYVHHPVVGDPAYGKRKIPPNLPKPIIDRLKSFKRQALHASMLAFNHPDTGKEMRFEAPLPEDMKRLLDTIEGRLK